MTTTAGPDWPSHVVANCGAEHDAHYIAHMQRTYPELLAALEYMVRAQAQPWDHADRRASKEKALAAIRKATEGESNV